MTREIPLSRGLVALVDDADHPAVVAAGPWHAHPGGRTFYAQHSINSRLGITMHAFLTGWSLVDHVNGDGLDNQRANLRLASRRLNAANRQVRRDSTSGFKGVCRNGPRGRPWRAQICVDYRKVHLGLFDTAEQAARAYDAAALSAWGSYARLNFPMEGS